MEHFIMNRKELEQVKVFEQVKLGTLSQAEAAVKLRACNKINYNFWG